MITKFLVKANLFSKLKLTIYLLLPEYKFKNGNKVCRCKNTKKLFCVNFYFICKLNIFKSVFY